MLSAFVLESLYVVWLLLPNVIDDALVAHSTLRLSLVAHCALGLSMCEWLTSA